MLNDCDEEVQELMDELVQLFQKTYTDWSLIKKDELRELFQYSIGATEIYTGALFLCIDEVCRLFIDNASNEHDLNQIKMWFLSQFTSYLNKLMSDLKDYAAKKERELTLMKVKQ